MSATCTPVMSNPKFSGNDFQGDTGVTDNNASLETEGGQHVGSPQRPLPSNHDHYYSLRLSSTSSFLALMVSNSSLFTPALLRTHSHLFSLLSTKPA